MEDYFNERLKLVQIINFDKVNEYNYEYDTQYERLLKNETVGFADVYLSQYNKESKSNDDIIKELYSELVKLDTRLGTTASEQLYKCLLNTTRLDIIQVGSFI